MIRISELGATGLPVRFRSHLAGSSGRYVDDTADEWASWSALVVPLRIGGGTRIKILEAFARRCPVISTELGAHGLKAIDGLHYLKAESPSDFSKAVARLASNPDLQEILTASAHKHFLQHFTWDKIESHVVELVSGLVHPQ